MRKGVLAGAGLALMGMCVADTASAELWRACVAAACLKDSCGSNGATVVVAPGMDHDDPATVAAGGVLPSLERWLQRRGTINAYDTPPQYFCTPNQATQAAADELARSIYTNMRNSFSDVTMLSASEVIPGYGTSSTPGPAVDSSTASNDDDGASGSSSSNDDDERAAQAQAGAQAREREAATAQTDRVRREQEAAVAEQARRDREAAISAQREKDRIAQETRRAEQQAAAEELRKKMDERNKASTETDANRCVSSASIRQNDTFQGNTAAYVTNGCGTPVDVRVCLLTETKGWNCGVTWGLASQSSWSHSSFQATGQVFVDARVSGSSRQLNSP